MSSNTPTYDSLSYQHKYFVDAYVGIRDGGKGRFNASKSYELAGYVPNRKNASRLKSNEDVQKAISERLDQFVMTDAEAAAVIGEQAKGSFAPFLRFDERTKLYEIDLTTEEAQEHLHLIKKIRQKKKITRTEDGKTWATIQLTVEIHDPQAAAHKIRSAHGSYVHKHEITGKDGQPIETINYHIDLTDFEKEEDPEEIVYLFDEHFGRNG